MQALLQQGNVQGEIVPFPAEINEAKKALGNLGIGGRGGEREGVRICQVGIPSLRHLPCCQGWSLKHCELLEAESDSERLEKPCTKLAREDFNL